MDPEELYMERLASRAEAAQEALADYGIAVGVSVTRSGSRVTEINIDIGLEGGIALLEAINYFVECRKYEEDMEDDELFGDVEFTAEEFETWGDQPEESDD